MRPYCLLARVLEVLPRYPVGVESPTLAVLLHTDPELIAARLTEAERRGMAWPVRSYAANNRSLWFASEANRDAWMALHPKFTRHHATKGPRAPSALPTEPRTMRRKADCVGVSFAQRGGVPAGVTLATMPRSQMPATNPNGVQVQICASPTYDARYQCAPGEQPRGAGFAAEWAGLRCGAF